MTVHTNLTLDPAFPATAKERPDVFRKTIDKVATLRARNVRVAFYGMALHRPDPSGPIDQEERDELLSMLEEDVKAKAELCAMLVNGKPVPDIPDDIRNWIHAIAAREPQKLARVKQICVMSEEILSAAKTGAPELGPALKAHIQESREGFFNVITELCEEVWREYNQQQRDDLEVATTAAVTLAHRLERLERIGKHVRLASLNASVEAARAGNVGKGLMVIAQEFKVLAEEIQSLAQAARNDVSAIQE